METMDRRPLAPCLVRSILALLCTGGAVLLLGGCPAPRPVRPPGRAVSRGCDGLPTVRFAEHLCARVADGSKRITLRARHRTEIRAGQPVQLVCMESHRRVRARIVSVRLTTWRGIDRRELVDDGFSGSEQMLAIMRGYYPGIGWDDPATVYRWEPLGACRAP